jgi:ferric-dicitrate binding protein FerR (iron transport regulator)
MTDFEPTTELHALLSAAAVSQLDDALARRLNELVRSDADARACYVQYMATHALLNWRHGGVPPLEMPLAPGEAAVLASPPATASRWWPAWAATAGIIALVGLIALLPPRLNAPQTPTTPGVVIRQQDARWDDGQSLALDRHLRPGRQTISEGTAHIELSSGAILALAGPIDFEITAPDRLHLYHGALRAYSPLAARGFTVTTPRGVQIVDVGTQFGVIADQEHRVEIHVFEGEVVVNGKQHLKAGAALRIDADGNSRPAPADAQRFPPISQ